MADDDELIYYEIYLHTLSDDELNSYHNLTLKEQTNVTPMIFTTLSRKDKIGTLLFHFFLYKTVIPGFYLWYEIKKFQDENDD